MAKRKDTSRSDLLDAAQALLQQRGYHGFSFRDLAAEVGISSASLHHHFPAKADLGLAIVQRHRDAWNRRLAVLAAETDDWTRRWQQMATMFASPGRDGHLLVMLAAHYLTLPPLVQDEARLLFSNLMGWLARFATEAKKRGELPPDTDAEALAHALLSLLQGGLLLSRLSPASLMDGVLRQTQEWLA